MKKKKLTKKAKVCKESTPPLGKARPPKRKDRKKTVNKSKSRPPGSIRSVRIDEAIDVQGMELIKNAEKDENILVQCTKNLELMVNSEGDDTDGFRTKHKKRKTFATLNSSSEEEDDIKSLQISKRPRMEEDLGEKISPEKQTDSNINPVVAIGSETPGETLDLRRDTNSNSSMNDRDNKPTDSNKHPCPLCNKLFAANVIDQHFIMCASEQNSQSDEAVARQLQNRDEAEARKLHKQQRENDDSKEHRRNHQKERRGQYQQKRRRGIYL